MTKYYDIQDKENGYTIGIMKVVNGQPVSFNYRLPHEPMDKRMEQIVEKVANDPLNVAKQLRPQYNIREMDLSWSGGYDEDE